MPLYEVHLTDGSVIQVSGEDLSVHDGHLFVYNGYRSDIVATVAHAFPAGGWKLAVAAAQTKGLEVDL